MDDVAIHAGSGDVAERDAIVGTVWKLRHWLGALEHWGVALHRSALKDNIGEDAAVDKLVLAHLVQ